MSSGINTLLKEVQQERITLGLNLTPADRNYPAPYLSYDRIKGRYDLLRELENRLMAGKYD